MMTSKAVEYQLIDSITEKTFFAQYADWLVYASILLSIGFLTAAFLTFIRPVSSPRVARKNQ
ncbi:hypothetical protein L0244_04185 [bacterium]|nr:hypothetical protein [bacterium]